MYIDDPECASHASVGLLVLTRVEPYGAGYAFSGTGWHVERHVLRVLLVHLKHATGGQEPAAFAAYIETHQQVLARLCLETQSTRPTELDVINSDGHPVIDAQDKNADASRSSVWLAHAEDSTSVPGR